MGFNKKWRISFMKQKNLGFGFNGTMLIIYQFVGFFLFTVFNSFAQNIQATGNMAFYGWDSTNVSKVYTVVILLSVLFQLLCFKKNCSFKTCNTPFSNLFDCKYCLWFCNGKQFCK